MCDMCVRGSLPLVPFSLMLLVLSAPFCWCAPPAAADPPPPPAQGVSGEEAAKSAWAGASIDLLTLLPSFAQEQKEVDKLLAKHEANYLLA